MIENVSQSYPNLSVIATTLRPVRTATSNDRGAISWSPADGIVKATQRDGLEILDRVGGGDSFRLWIDLRTAGRPRPVDRSRPWRCARRAGHDHPGDTSAMTNAEVFSLARGGSARVVR